MAALPHELTINILCHLSRWCSSIDNPDFIKHHLSHSLKTNTNHSLLLRHCGYHFFSVNYDSLKTTQTLKILGSCNGLLALENDNQRIFLWNQSTRKSQVLPSTEIGLAGFTCYGFGYDPISDDYKVVRMLNKRFGFLANNAIHWRGFKTPQSGKESLAGFDLASEEFRSVELPDFCLDEPFWFGIEALGGYLCLSAVHSELGDIVADVWIMKEYGVKESWIKLISWNQPHYIPSVVVPLAFSKNGKKVLFNIGYKWFSFGERDKFVWYDVGSERVENVETRGLPSKLDVHLYVESLVPLNSNAQQ
ncbi:hypothetical protein E1A91_A08G021800v1 [Gossypium mustelinum]|uniref:F-box associated beta-propeller type 3 domain-containing protein n=2 Tax=Gossypium TaxID=3633 RepID=A0A5D2Y3H3_GOSMU|nr:hypothetical protein ES332_A08G021200v1 [Gossypium tomentosum]TYJ20805.1 hypothetical protein E1A91_A08G021800v1 [Gossypium mustelinum]